MISTDRRSTLGLLGGAAALVGSGRGPARAAGPVQMISHRFPQLEMFAERMRSAVPGVTVNTQLMPFDKAMELATIALSSKADTVDIVFQSEGTFLKYVKNGWLRPLNDLWEKYRAEFALDDFPESVVKALSYDGKLYVMPHVLNVMLFFYRQDLFEKAGKKPPATFEEYLELAAAFHTPLSAGTISCLKPVDAALNEIHWYMNALGPGWFDERFRPVFNGEKGVAAIETLKRATQFAQKGFTAAANDECALALQQGVATMGLQWVSRAGAMDDPKKSTVVGKIAWATPPVGAQRVSVSGYSISAFSKQDPDLLFRIIATSASKDSIRAASIHGLPIRRSLLDDAELKAQNRHFPAALAALEVARPFPPLPEFYEVGEFITRRVLQAVTGELPVKQALDLAAQETSQLLKSRGYDL